MLKVALSDEKAARLAHEARVLRRLSDSRVIRLARQEPIQIGGRTVIVLEHAGELTRGPQAPRGRPAHRRRAGDVQRTTCSARWTTSRVRASTTGTSSRTTSRSGFGRTAPGSWCCSTSPWPRVGRGHRGRAPRATWTRSSARRARPVYDEHAERYALAVTLHEMASGELPVWGDGAPTPSYTDGPPVLAAEAFDPAIRDGLVGFFPRALHRDASERFASLKEMRDAWQQVFRQSDRDRPGRLGAPGRRDEPR